MTGTIDQTVAEALLTFSPRQGFAAELLIALRRAAAGLHPAPPESQGWDRWVLASSIAGVATAASAAAVFGFRRMSRRGKAA
jgi:hypothetical protein